MPGPGSADERDVDPIETPAAQTSSGKPRWELPPLILHPFADPNSPGKLLESTKASLMLYGLLPGDDFSHDELTRKMLEGRLCEVRMLFFVGKDVSRWIAQCQDFANHQNVINGVTEQSFAELLIENTPAHVAAKLRRWGVNDYRAIFSRALGINAIFREAPTAVMLAESFVRHYYRYADQIYSCRQALVPFTSLRADDYHFELYASGEYSRMLEQQWGE
jgi:hypothetical protein